ncbi:MAG: DUF2520 domain-containing protein [Micrococcales bacterium]|nr:DUF2520 domain-containing protein [Micrococcales bacterium]
MQRQPVAFGLIGVGRVGGPISRALSDAGYPVVGVSAYDEESRERAEVMLPGVPLLEAAEVVDKAALVWLTVSDDAITPLCQELASSWRPGQVVVHASGARGLAALAPAARAGAITLAIHPAMTFTGTSIDVVKMHQAPFAITTPVGLEPLAEALVQALGGWPFVVHESDRPLYHTALAHLSNHLVTLVDQARQLIQTITGADPHDLLEPLALASLEAALRHGIDGLSGAVSRGDVTTLVTHRQALENWAASRGGLVSGEVALDDRASAALDTVRTYRELALMTARAAERAGRIDAAAVEAIGQALD